MWIINKILNLFGKNRDEEDDLEFTHIKLGTMLLSKDGIVLAWGESEDHIEKIIKEQEEASE